MKFDKLSFDTKIKDLINLGYEDGDFVILLSSNGQVNHGKLRYITEYSTLFDILVQVSDYESIDVASAIGICKVEWN